MPDRLSDADLAASEPDEHEDLANLTWLVSLGPTQDELATKINEQTKWLAAEVEALRAENEKLRKDRDYWQRRWNTDYGKPPPGFPKAALRDAANGGHDDA